jgi:Lon protease-like protein
MTELRDLPLLPLHTVLFPGQALSLHIFEERYKLMIDRCLQEKQPIGIVLIREGEEVGEPALPHDVGTLANILETERHESGEIDIVAVGQERFVIDRILQERPYIVGQVATLGPVGKDAPRAWALAHRARELLHKYVEALADATGTLVQVLNVPEEPASVAFLVALALQVRHAERQRLLATADIGDMLAREILLLGREIAIWRHLVATQEAEKERESGQFGRIASN